MARDDDPVEVYRITGAAPSRSQDLDRRVHRYLISMAIRTACVVLVFVVPGPARWVFAIAAVFLPYVAVLFANAGGTPRGDGPAPVDRRGLAAGRGTPGPPPEPPAGPPSGPSPRAAEGSADAPDVLHGHVVEGSGPASPRAR